MKLSTRARYALRMMVEFARELKKEKLVHLGKIARITGLSENYLAQLVIPLKSNGLLIGVSGQKGGYQFSRAPEDIKIGEIVKAVIGPLNLTECVSNPDICLNSSFCEARLVWAILSDSMNRILDKFSLADLIEKDSFAKIKEDYSYLSQINLNPDNFTGENTDRKMKGCPVQNKNNLNQEESKQL